MKLVEVDCLGVCKYSDKAVILKKDVAKEVSNPNAMRKFSPLHWKRPHPKKPKQMDFPVL